MHNYSRACLLRDSLEMSAAASVPTVTTQTEHSATEHNNECFGSGHKSALCKLTFRVLTAVTINISLYCSVVP